MQNHSSLIFASVFDQCKACDKLIFSALYHQKISTKMGVKVPFVTTLLILSVFRVQCKQIKYEKIKTVNYENLSSSPLQQVSKANLDFSLNLHNIFGQKLTNKTFIFSPLSLASGLSGIKMGAKGKTALEFDTALEQEKLNNSFVQDGFFTLLGSIEGDQHSKIQVINQLFTSSKYKLDENFVTTMKKQFSGGAHSLDFERDDDLLIAYAMNDVISNVTDKRLQSFIASESLLGYESGILLSTIYFKSAWEWNFSPLMTQKSKFHTLDGLSVPIDMMTRSGYYDYGEIRELNSTVLSVPYKSKRFALTVILPAPGITMEELEENLISYQMPDVYTSMKTTYIQVSLPKCRLHQYVDMNKSGFLSEMGIHKALTEEADFTKLSAKEGLKIDTVIQNVTLDITEGGAETVAPNFVESVPATFRYLESFTVNRPFIAFVYDHKTKTILFSGRKLY